LAELSAQPD
jgi:adenylosuccinate synthase